MKFVMGALVALVLSTPVKAAQDSIIQQLARCQAANLSLLQLHHQMAASITAMSDNPPHQLLLMRESYLALAQTDQANIDAMTKLIKEVILPAYKDSKNFVDQYVPLLSQALGQIQTGLGDLHYDGQVQVQKVLLTLGRSCEGFSERLMNEHTL